MRLKKIPVIAVAGPTASGKTSLAVALARRFDGEVLSFDSMQLYKGMDIATAKPSVEEVQGIPHHMINCVDRGESFSVAKYKAAATEIADDIVSRGKHIVMVGGTGLYLDSFINNIEFTEDDEETRRKIREELKAELEAEGPAAMLEKLSAVDPETAKILHPNNTGRVLRALEIYRSTGHTMSYQVEHSRDNPGKYAPVYIGLTARDRQFLYDRINARVDRMMEAGLLDEAKVILSGDPGDTSRQAIGIKELKPYFDGEATLEDCVEKIKQETRRYAKRQLTWFSRNKEIHWFFIDEMKEDEIIKAAEQLVKEGIA